MSEPIAPIVKLSWLGRPPQGVPFTITIEIGAPYEESRSPETWVCRLKLYPFLREARDVYGGNSLQALSLALCVVGDQLQDFLDNGGTLLYDTGDAFDLEPYRLGNFKPH